MIRTFTCPSIRTRKTDFWFSVGEVSEIPNDLKDFASINPDTKIVYLNLYDLSDVEIEATKKIYHSMSGVVEWELWNGGYYYRNTEYMIANIQMIASEIVAEAIVEALEALPRRAHVFQVDHDSFLSSCILDRLHGFNYTYLPARDPSDANSRLLGVPDCDELALLRMWGMI